MKRTLRPSFWPAAVFFVLAAAFGPLFDSFWLSLLTLVFFYAFMGLSWNLMMSAGLLSLGHALFLGLGAYAAAVLTASAGVSPWLSIPAGAVIAAMAGSAIAWIGGRFSVRGVQFAVLTIAFSELTRVLFDNWDLVGGTGGFFLKAINPDTNRPLVTLRGGPLYFYFAFLVITAAAYFVIQLLMTSRWGFRWRGINEDEDAARALGVPALRSKVLVVAISAGLAGLGGGLFGLMQGSLFPESVMRLQLSIEILIAPIIGGLGSPFGSIVGAFFVVPLMEFSNTLGQRIGYYGLNTLIYGVVILGIIAFLPDGIWPRILRYMNSKSCRMILQVRNLTKAFTGLVAVKDVSFGVAANEIVALIGPNGAGKTTCFNMIAGALKPSSGSVVLGGEMITGLMPEQIAVKGLVRTFQIVRPMRTMTVLENVMIGAFARTANVEQALEIAAESVRNVGLESKESALASALTLPDRKMLELARAIAARPKLLLLDEVMAGLRPFETDRIVEIVRALKARGVTVLLIEHVMRVVVALADRIVVLHHGEKLAEGLPSEIGANPKVIESYLGRRAKLS